MANKNQYFGNQVRNIRKRLKLNQEEFGKLFSPSAPKSIVSRWEHGGMPNNQRIAKIAELGNISIDRLINKPINRIAELMKENNLTSENVADKIDSDKKTIDYYLKGNDPSVEDWAKLSELFDVTIAYLKGESNDRHGVMVGTNYTFEDFAKIQGIFEEDIENLSDDNKRQIARTRLTSDLVLSFLAQTLGSSQSKKELSKDCQKFLNNYTTIVRAWDSLIIDDVTSNRCHINNINKISDQYLNSIAEYMFKNGLAEKSAK